LRASPLVAFILLAGAARSAWPQARLAAELDRALELYRTILVVLDETVVELYGLMVRGRESLLLLAVALISKSRRFADRS
jgi:hypothetical protein